MVESVDARMEIRYYEDPDSGLPHIYGHGIDEAEVEQVLARRVRPHRLRTSRQEQASIPAAATEKRAMKKKTKLPPGWTDKRVREVIQHYENQTEDEQYAEIEAARRAKNITMMAFRPNWYRRCRR